MTSPIFLDSAQGDPLPFFLQFIEEPVDIVFEAFNFMPTIYNELQQMRSSVALRNRCSYPSVFRFLCDELGINLPE